MNKMESKYNEFFIVPILEWTAQNNVSCQFDALNFTIKKDDIIVFVEYDITDSSVLMSDNMTSLHFHLDRMEKKISLHALYYFFGKN